MATKTIVAEKTCNVFHEHEGKTLPTKNKGKKRGVFPPHFFAGRGRGGGGGEDGGSGYKTSEAQDF